MWMLRKYFTYHIQTWKRNPNSPLMQWLSSEMKLGMWKSGFLQSPNIEKIYSYIPHFNLEPQPKFPVNAVTFIDDAFEKIFFFLII